MQRQMIDNTVGALVIILLFLVGSCVANKVAFAKQDKVTAPEPLVYHILWWRE